jgi:hypothetical protein
LSRVTHTDVREPFGVTIATCQLRDVLDRVGDKWSVRVQVMPAAAKTVSKASVNLYLGRG